MRRGLYFKTSILVFHTPLLKCFIYNGVGILDSPWCNNSCRAYKELGQGEFYSFDQEKVPFLSIYLLPTHRKSYPQGKSCPLQSHLQYLSHSGHLKPCKTPDFFFLLIFLSSKLSTINDYHILTSQDFHILHR